MNVVKAINQEEFQGFSFINPDYGKMSYCPTSDIHWPLLFLKKECDFFPLFPYTNYYEKKKQTEESDKVPRLQEWRGIHRKRKRRKHSIEGTPYFFFFISIYSNFMSVNNIWVDTDEPIFPYIPAICCGVSPVL